MVLLFQFHALCITSVNNFPKSKYFHNMSHQQSKNSSSDNPPFISVGNAVSARYKGAYCEAVIMKVIKNVQCKVRYKCKDTAIIDSNNIRGVLTPGSVVKVQNPDSGNHVEGTIINIKDLSTYTVVFDDGDQITLKRSAICLKSDRHFKESDSLNQAPLVHPERFSKPVKDHKAKLKNNQQSENLENFDHL